MGFAHCTYLDKNKNNKQQKTTKQTSCNVYILFFLVTNPTTGNVGTYDIMHNKTHRRSCRLRRPNKTCTLGRGTYMRNWSKQQPGTHERTVMMKSCGKKCFLGPNKTFPICAKGTCKVNRKGVYAAYVRAKEYQSIKKSRKYQRISAEARKLMKGGRQALPWGSEFYGWAKTDSVIAIAYACHVMQKLYSTDPREVNQWSKYLKELEQMNSSSANKDIERISEVQTIDDAVELFGTSASDYLPSLHHIVRGNLKGFLGKTWTGRRYRGSDMFNDTIKQSLYELLSHKLENCTKTLGITRELIEFERQNYANLFEKGTIDLYTSPPKSNDDVIPPSSQRQGQGQEQEPAGLSEDKFNGLKEEIEKSSVSNILFVYILCKSQLQCQSSIPSEHASPNNTEHMILLNYLSGLNVPESQGYSIYKLSPKQLQECMHLCCTLLDVSKILCLNYLANNEQLFIHKTVIDGLQVNTKQTIVYLIIQLLDNSAEYADKIIDNLIQSPDVILLAGLLNVSTEIVKNKIIVNLIQSRDVILLAGLLNVSTKIVKNKIIDKLIQSPDENLFKSIHFNPQLNNDVKILINKKLMPTIVPTGPIKSALKKSKPYLTPEEEQERELTEEKCKEAVGICNGTITVSEHGDQKQACAKMVSCKRNTQYLAGVPILRRDQDEVFPTVNRFDKSSYL